MMWMIGPSELNGGRETPSHGTQKQIGWTKKRERTSEKRTSDQENHEGLPTENMCMTQLVKSGGRET